MYVYEGGWEGQNNLIKPNDQVHVILATRHESIPELLHISPTNRCCYMWCYSLHLVIWGRQGKRDGTEYLLDGIRS